jgi:DNA polymerase (family 10)
LDLETKWVRAAREKGVMISINPDAHNRVALGDVDYGVTIARRGWVSRETVLNAQDPERALAYFRRNR